MARQRTTWGFSGWLSMSAVVHLALAAAVTRLFLLPPDMPAEVPDMHAVELEALTEAEQQEAVRRVQGEPPDSPELRARLGDLERLRLDGAADTLRAAEQAGALAGQGEARPNREPLAGEDLDDLRYRPLNHLSRDTPSRIRTASRAVTPDNRRQTPNPALSPHLVSGKGRGTWRERGRSRRWRRRPDRAASRATSPGGPGLEPSILPDEAPGSAPGDERFRQPEQVAQVAPGQRRPELHRAPPTTASRTIDLDLADDRVRHQASTRRFPDRMDAARAGGRGRQSGKGAGARAGRAGDPEGEQRGPAIWLNNPDSRYLRYFRRVHRKIQPLWAFPRELEVTLEQGEVLVRFTIRADGAVSDVHVKKSSGFPSFDRVVVAAIRKAAPFGPIPAGLGTTVKVLAPFEFLNPMVR